MEKKRAPNFSPSEKELLNNIILNYKSIIENKKTDDLTWRDKDTAWDKITTTFNSQSPDGVHRSKDNLGKLYDNLKRALRKEVADEKRELYRTGGGLPGSKILCKAGSSQALLNIVNHKTVFGLESVYDGDKIKTVDDLGKEDTGANVYKDHNCTKAVFNEDGEDVHPTNIASTLESPITWKTTAASTLKRPATKELKSHWLKRRRPPIQQPAGQLVDEYAALAKVKQEVFEAEKKNKKGSRKGKKLFSSWRRRN